MRYCFMPNSCLGVLFFKECLKIMLGLCVTLILCRKFKNSRIPNGVRRRHTIHSTPEESRVESRFFDIFEYISETACRSGIFDYNSYNEPEQQL